MEIKVKSKISFNVSDSQPLNFSEVKSETPDFSAKDLVSIQNGYSPYVNEDGYWMYYDATKGWLNTGIHAEGPQGIQGIQGEPGPQGEAGPQGIQGIQGIQGEKGDKGETGAVGPQGIQGEKGDKGEKGDQGIQGIQGIQGEMGPPGPQGEKGEKGAIGDIGPQGPQGIRGEKGDTGPQGIQGERGLQGIQGEAGPQGIQGPQGEQGIQGEKGEKGDGFSIYKVYSSVEQMNADIANVPLNEFVLISSMIEDEDNSKLFVRKNFGFSFLTDMSGAQGIQGPRGERGLQGPQGIQGVQGIQGPQGEQGIQGEKGENGKSAYQVAVENGYTGAEEEWLESLKGETGDSGVYVGNEEPIDPDVNIWIDPDEDGYDIIREIDNVKENLDKKQDVLIPGAGISIAEDGKTISAAVSSVNGKVGDVRLNASDVGAATQSDLTKIEEKLSKSITTVLTDGEELATRYIDVEDYESGYINNRGVLVQSTEYVHTKPFHVRAGDKIIANVAGYSTIVSIVAKKVDDTNYVSLSTSVDRERREYNYTITEECDIVVSFWLKADRTVKLYTTFGTVSYMVDELSDYCEATYTMWKNEELDSLYENGLISINGTLYKPTDVRYKHISLTVNAGERYLISGQCNNSEYSGAWFCDASGFKEYVYNVPDSTFEDYLVIIPDGVTTLIVNGSSIKHILKVVKQTRLTGEYISSIEKSLLNNTSNDEFERMCLRDRALRAEKGNDFAWAEFDKAYFVFVNDDTNSFFPSCKALFESKNVPLCAAVLVDSLDTVYSGQTKTVEALLHEMVSNGGEVLAHYNYNLYENSTDTEWYEHAIKPKKILLERGFVCDGLIRANLTTVGTNKGERVCRDYYRYSDDVGISTQYHQPRKFFMGVDTLDKMKAFIDNACVTKGFFPFCLHGNRADEPLATIENLGAIIDYIQAKGASVAEIGTYKSVYDAFGTTGLEKNLATLSGRVSVVETALLGVDDAVDVLMEVIGV